MFYGRKKIATAILAGIISDRGDSQDSVHVVRAVKLTNLLIEAIKEDRKTRGIWKLFHQFWGKK